MFKSIAYLPCAAAVASLTLLPTISSANDIILTSPDNTVRLVGEFVGFELDTYVIRINDIEMRVSAMMMNCEGTGCLNFQPVAASATSG